MTVDIKAAIKAANQAKDAIAALNGQIKVLNEEEQALRDRRKFVSTEALSPEDIRAFMLRTVDDQASLFIGASGWQTVFRDFVIPRRNKQDYEKKDEGRPLCLEDVQKVEDDGPRAILSIVGPAAQRLHAAQMGQPQHYAAFSCFFFGDLIKAKISEHFDELAGPLPPFDGSVPASLEARVEEIKKIDARLSEIISLRTELTSQRDMLKR